MKFKIWYENTCVDGHSPQDWMNFPKEGVVAILEFFDNNCYRLCIGSDWYWLEGTDVIQSITTHNDPGHFVENPVPHNHTVKTGKWVSDDRMNAVHKEICEIIDG